MYEAQCAAAVKPRHAVICPHCTERLKIDENPDNPTLDDPLSCHFHGVIGTRLEVIHPANSGELDTVKYELPDEPARGGLNNYGYHPQAGDQALLARLMFTESGEHPNYYPDIGWATINRIGAPGFEKTLQGVVFQRSQYSQDFESTQWKGAANPSSMDVLDRKSYAIAVRWHTRF